MREPEDWCSSISSALPSLSSVNESMLAIGLQPVDYRELVEALPALGLVFAYFADELDFVTFNIFHRKDIDLG